MKKQLTESELNAIIKCVKIRREKVKKEYDKVYGRGSQCHPWGMDEDKAHAVIDTKCELYDNELQFLNDVINRLTDEKKEEKKKDILADIKKKEAEVKVLKRMLEEGDNK
jgi:hypothetical protein